MTTWRPMSEFNPDKPARVHDRLNDKVLDWSPSAFAAHYHRCAYDFGEGVIEWDGLLLDGWRPSQKWSWRKIALGVLLILLADTVILMGLIGMASGGSPVIGAGLIAFGVWLAWPVAQELGKRR